MAGVGRGLYKGDWAEIGTGLRGQDHHRPPRPPLMSLLEASALTCHSAGLRKLVSNDGPQ